MLVIQPFWNARVQLQFEHARARKEHSQTPNAVSDTLDPEHAFPRGRPRDHLLAGPEAVHLPEAVVVGLPPLGEGDAPTPPPRKRRWGDTMPPSRGLGDFTRRGESPTFSPVRSRPALPGKDAARPTAFNAQPV